MRKLAVGSHYRAHELLERREPKDLGLEYTSIQRFELSKGVELHRHTEESCVVVLKGKLLYACSDQDGEAHAKDMLYVPAGARLTLYSSAASVITFSAPSETKSPFAHVRFQDVDGDPAKHRIFGSRKSGCRRHVWSFIDAEFPCSRLLVGLCHGSPGGWTAWPPHEHGDKREEVYVYFGMEPAFAIQCLYEDLREDATAIIVRDGDVVSIPHGFHPNVSCPAGALSYIYCMTSKTPGDRDFMDLHFQELYGSGF